MPPDNSDTRWFALHVRGRYEKSTAELLGKRGRDFRALILGRLEAPEPFDISKESEATQKLYGIDRPETRDFGWQCLMALRLAHRDIHNGTKHLGCIFVPR